MSAQAMPPLFSILTPTLNRAGMLEGAIRSVLDQRYPRFEHIILDAGSTDGTAELVARYPHLRFDSRPDAGIYDALNRGIQLAGGDLIGFLNSDDLYGDGIFKRVADRFEDSQIQGVVGNAIVFVDDPVEGRKVVHRFVAGESDLVDCVTRGANYFNAWFFRRAVFSQIGMLDARLRIAADRDFMLRFLASSPKFARVDHLAYQYRRHPDSLTIGSQLVNQDRTARELVTMIDGYRRSRTLPSEMLGGLMRKRSEATVEMAVRYLKAQDLRRATEYLALGWRADAIWPLRFLRASLRRPV